MKETIFRKYDIRGIVGEELDDNIIEKIGKSFGSIAKTDDVVVGWDIRKSSEKIKNIIVDALISTGKKVYLIGMVPTPLMYFAVKVKGINNGIMITASHNPPEYNGFKMIVNKEGLYGEGIKKLLAQIKKQNFKKGRGSVTEINIVDDYVSFIKERVSLKNKISVAFDSGNGSSGPLIKKLTSEIPVQSTFINLKPDGNFPAHLPDPTVPKYMKSLGELVKTKGFQFGIGFDGDGDRLGVVDEKGELVFGDKLIAIFAKDLLSRHQGAEIIVDVKSSQGIVEYIESLGGKVYMYKTGHSLIKAELKRRKGLLAGEMSGHLFFGENFPGYDDALYAALKFIQIVLQSGKTVSQLVSEIPFYYSTPEIRIPCPDEIKFSIVESLKKYFRKKYKVIEIDGARVIMNKGWGLVRASNTQPVLVLRFESKEEKYLKKIEEEFKNALKIHKVKWEKE